MLSVCFTSVSWSRQASGRFTSDAGVLSSMQFGKDEDTDPMTCRGRAAHARLAAKEANDDDFMRIFERLAELYEAKAVKLEAAAKRAKSVQSEDGSERH